MPWGDLLTIWDFCWDLSCWLLADINRISLPPKLNMLCSMTAVKNGEMGRGRSSHQQRPRTIPELQSGESERSGPISDANVSMSQAVHTYLPTGTLNNESTVQTSNPHSLLTTHTLLQTPAQPSTTQYGSQKERRRAKPHPFQNLPNDDDHHHHIHLNTATCPQIATNLQQRPSHLPRHLEQLCL